MKLFSALSAPDFWFAPQPSVLASALRPMGWIYGEITARRMGQAGFGVGVPVICIGNFVVGGTGKTPMAIAVAHALLAVGKQPFFLSRGYGGQTHRTPLRVSGQHVAAQVGDEPRLLAEVAPVIVCGDRAAGARAAVEAGADVLIMDDGLQNPKLAKNIGVAMVDGATGFGNGLCLPAGPLRAPLGAQWPHVAAVVIVGKGAAGDVAARLARAAGRAVLRGQLVPDAAIADSLRGRKIIAFAGIGRPQKFFDTLAGLGAVLVARHCFGDHHCYSEREMAALQAQASASGAMLVTTQKDLARTGSWSGWPTPIALPVHLVLDTPISAILAGLMAQN